MSKSFKSQTPARCYECGRELPAGITYRKVYDKETGQFIGDHCYTACSTHPTTDNDRLCLQLIKFLDLQGCDIDHANLSILADGILKIQSMRELQRAYFKTRDKDLIPQAKDLEKMVDIFLSIVHRPKLAEQPALFPEDDHENLST